MFLVPPVLSLLWYSKSPPLKRFMNLQGIMMTHDLYEAVMYFLCCGEHELLLCLSIACQHQMPISLFHATVTLTNYRIQSRPKWLNSADREALCSCPKSKAQLWVLCVNKSLQKIKHLLCFPNLTQDKAFPFISLSIFTPVILQYIASSTLAGCVCLHLWVCEHICQCGCLCFLDEVKWCH